MASSWRARGAGQKTVLLVLLSGGDHRHSMALPVLAAALLAGAHTHTSAVTLTPAFAASMCCKRQQIAAQQSAL